MARMVYIDVLKSTCMAIVVMLHALEIAGACRLECNWTQPTFYFEYMSGLFFMISGIVNAMSVCGRLERSGSRLAVLRSQGIRGIVLAIVGVSMQSVERMLRPLLRPDTPFAAQTVRDLVDEGVYTRFVSGLYSAISDPRALAFHGLCTFLSACVLVAVAQLVPANQPRGRTAAAAPALVLLLAVAVLAAHPSLRRAADRATCCRVEVGADCKDTATADVDAALRVRVPARCEVVVGNGTAAAGSPFDPCDFDVSVGGSLAHGYLPPCEWRAVSSATAAAIMNASHWEVPPSSDRLCERTMVRRIRSECVDGGPWKLWKAQAADGHGPNATGDGASVLTCVHLATSGACPQQWSELREWNRLDGDGGDVPAADEPIAEWCPLACMPWLCANSRERREQEAAIAADLELSRVAEAEAEKPPEERERLEASRRRVSSQEERLAAERRQRLSDRGVPAEEEGRGAASARATAGSTPPPSVSAADEAGEMSLVRQELYCRQDLTSKLLGQARRVHGLPHAQLGKLWCPKVVESAVTGMREVVASACKRVVWWENVAMTLEGKGATERALGVALQLTFGLHGILSYLAASLAGVAVGMHLHLFGPTRRLFLCGSACCLASFAVGLHATYELRKPHEIEGEYTAQPAADAFLRCGSHNRLLWGAADMGIILLGVGLVDAVPARREAWARATSRYQQLGAMSLTMYAWGDLAGRACYVPFAQYAQQAQLVLGGITIDDVRAPDSRPKEVPLGPSRTSLAEDFLLMAFLITVVVGYVCLFALWRRVAYAGSFEWCLGKLLGTAKATCVEQLAPRPRQTSASAATAAAPTPAVARPDGRGTCAPGERGGASAPSSTAAREPGDDDVATVWIWILTITWTPSAMWAVVCHYSLAPSMDDFYHKHNATHFFLAPPTAEVRLAAERDGAPDGPPVRLTISALVFLVTYVVPVTTCLLRLGWLRYTHGGRVKRKLE